MNSIINDVFTVIFISISTSSSNNTVITIIVKIINVINGTRRTIQKQLTPKGIIEGQVLSLIYERLKIPPLQQTTS